jgi:hypothetical protein
MCDSSKANALTGGIWLIGFGVLFATGHWWPGILFLVGITTIVQSWLRGHPLYAMHGGFWVIFIGIWAAFRFNMALLFIGLGIYTILTVLLGPNPLRKPHVDSTLE